MNFRILKILLCKEIRLMKRSPFITHLIVAIMLMVMLVFPLVANIKEIGFPELSGYVMKYFNPILDVRNYMMSILMVVLLIIMCGFIPMLNIINEKKTGTMEAMNVTPVGKFTFVLSKLIPYWVIGFLAITVAVIIGWLICDLIPAGNVVDIYIAAILFGLAMSGLGVTIANKSTSIPKSIFMMIFQLMGGTCAPIALIPQWAKYFSFAVPPSYLIEIIRSVYMNGATIADLGMQYILLTCLAVVFCGIAAITYKKQS